MTHSALLLFVRIVILECAWRSQEYSERVCRNYNAKNKRPVVFSFPYASKLYSLSGMVKHAITTSFARIGLASKDQQGRIRWLLLNVLASPFP